jgi:amino acid transporter
MRTFQSFALSLSVISVLTGGITLFGHGLRWGGPFEMTVGWPLVTVMTLFIAASLGELGSAYPTAGALYHWSAIHGGRAFGFFTAWLNALGQIAVTAGIDYGLAELLSPALGLSGGRVPILLLTAAILLTQATLNHVGVRVVARLSDLSAVWHLVGTGVLIGALVALAPHQPIAFLFERASAEPKPYLYGFLVGMLQAAWTFTGYDASAHASEETLNAAHSAPRGMFLSVVVSGVLGWAMLLALASAVGDLRTAQTAENPFIHVVTGALGPIGGQLLVWLALVAMWFCGLASVTSNSRMLYAFARDGGLPGSDWIARVSSRFQTPHVAVWVSALAALGVALWADLYSAMVALSTVALYASYALPIVAVLLTVRRGGSVQRGPWHLGGWSRVVNLVAVGWIAFVSVVFVLPPNTLAGYTFAGFLALLVVYWKLHMRARFKGPPQLAPSPAPAPAPTLASGHGR